MSNRGEASSGWTPNQDPRPHKPWISWLIPTIAIVNIVFFAYSMYANDCPARHPPGDVCILFPYLGRYSFEPLYINPLLGPAPGTLDTLGALDYKKIVSGEPWRLISCIWLHGGVIHLLVNMLSLLFIGIRQEQEFGFWKVGTLYIISGIGGSLMSSLSIHNKISVGASGALFGLLGAMLSELMINWALYANKCAALLTLLVVIALNMAVGMVPHVDSSAHIGGFISGFFLGFILLIRPQFGWVNQNCFPPGYDMNHIKPKHKVYQYVLWILAFVMFVIWCHPSTIKEVLDPAARVMKLFK
ncbi:RHOMBOID-like protein 5 isoform X2 [Phalaenopsis equestris]|uniref:RHOMBOID-like protein 5 isoform X2 n=1 Tax=Phalaenopsis equestris TaxID=78828 RepID=UPI0009E3CCEE|nr:RHOMBOID-like protein 5 isoform X2 [Phalaenopsis equestris]